MGYAVGSSVAFSPDGRMLATGGLHALVYLWDLETGKEAHRFGGMPGPPLAVVFSPTGRTVLAIFAWRVYEWEVGNKQMTGAPGRPGHCLPPDGRSSMTIEVVNGQLTALVRDLPSGAERGRTRQDP